jgi:ADP-ribose pyrophosphatase
MKNTLGETLTMDTIQPWEELSREEVFKQYHRKIEKVVFRLPDGKENDFYIKKEGRAVGVVAFTANQEVVLFEQFRPGPMKVLKELPGGGMEPGENPEAAGARELLEETGYQGNAQYIGTLYDCAYSTMQRFCVVVTNAKKVREPKHDATEFGRVILVSLADFRELLRSGQMTDVEIGYRALDALNLL